ncbi:MAG: citronellol/citronellal dehydrogenase [Paraglaciecola sp.]|jgi:citronellol/citronellal dehydrogenase
MPYQSQLSAKSFNNKNIIVTGGGSGIGRCVAHELTSLGAHVIIMGRKESKLSTVVSEIESDGGKVNYVICDIRDEQAVAAAVTNALSHVDQIDGLVNNAGGQYPSPLADINQKGWETVIRTNLTGGFLMSKEVYNQSMRKTGGSIVNIIADMWNGMPTMGHSGAARAGMENFTKTAAYEWANSGVRVNAVAPGWIITSGMDTYPPDFAPVLDSLRSAIPLKRMGREAEVSAPICFLLSAAAAYISGTTIRVDGASTTGNAAVIPLTEHSNAEPYHGFHREILPEIAKKLKW